jgi:hypothetical protein
MTLVACSPNRQSSILLKTFRNKCATTDSQTASSKATTTLSITAASTGKIGRTSVAHHINWNARLGP